LEQQVAANESLSKEHLNPQSLEPLHLGNSLFVRENGRLSFWRDVIKENLQGEQGKVESAAKYSTQYIKVEFSVFIYNPLFQRRILQSLREKICRTLHAGDILRRQCLCVLILY
jgi:hypothetical protein